MVSPPPITHAGLAPAITIRPKKNKMIPGQCRGWRAGRLHKAARAAIVSPARAVSPPRMSHARVPGLISMSPNTNRAIQGHMRGCQAA